LIEREIDMAQLLYQETNFKEKLLQYFHLRKFQDPVYGLLDQSGMPNKKQYTIYVKSRKDPNDEGTIVGIGTSTSKPKSEQLAAFQALKHYSVIIDEDGIDDEVEELNSSDESDLSDYESEEEK